MDALDFFKQGYSCSESIIKEGIERWGLSDELLPVATAFSGGMGSGCLCGAVSGAQMVIGALHGKVDGNRDGLKSRELAKKFIEEFKKLHNHTCCKVLTAKLDFHSPERKENCATLVNDCSKILSNILQR